MRKPSLAWFVVAGVVLAAAPLLAQDNLDGPWASPFGGMYGTARAPFPVIFPPGGEWEVAWMLDTFGEGARLPANASQMVFDADGNLYWHSQGHWSDSDHVASCTPTGEMRWIGPPGGIGDMQSDITPIVGQDAVYMIGMFDPNEYDPEDPCLGFTSQQIFALSKVDGSVIWRIKLDNDPDCPEGPDPITNNAQPNPIVYNGRLFVMGLPESSRGVAVYQIDAATGTILGNNVVSQIRHKMCGNTVLLPDKFGPGVHGMYVLAWDQIPAQIFGLEVDTNTNTASLVWQSSPEANGSEIGQLGWWSFAHVMYNQTYDRIYTYTEDNSFAYDFFSFDPIVGDDWAMWADGGDWGLTKGWYQTGAVDFDDTRMLTGAFDGGFSFYADDGDGNVSFTESIHHLVWDHPRQFVQLLYDSETQSTVAVTASSGMGTGMTHVYMCDLDDRDPPAEDGPTYIDEIEVYQGPNPNDLTLVWSEDFEAYDEGPLPSASGWVNLVDPEQSEPVVAEDPTGEGHGKVLVLDPVRPSDPNTAEGHGAYHAFTQTTGNVVVTRYKQWRQDTSEIYEVMWGQDPDDYERGFAYTYDWDSRICSIEWLDTWSQPNYQVDQRWEGVVFTYNFPASSASVQVADRDPVTSSWSGESFAPTNSAAGFGITMWHGQVSDNFPRLRVNHLQDVRGSWLDVDVHGGPLVGPDGKIYYFEAQSGWQPPNEHPGWLFALQPKGQCAGDVDGDGDTDLSDLAALLAAYGSGPGDPNWNAAADFDGDDDVDLGDLAFLLADYGCGA
jgi:hypothetical protein